MAPSQGESMMCRALLSMRFDTLQLYRWTMAKDRQEATETVWINVIKCFTEAAEKNPLWSCLGNFLLFAPSYIQLRIIPPSEQQQQQCHQQHPDGARERRSRGHQRQRPRSSGGR